MEMITSWHKEGRELGRQEGRQEGWREGRRILALQLQHRLSTLPADITERLDKLTPEQTTELAIAMLDFARLSDLEAWLSSH